MASQRVIMSAAGQYSATHPNAFWRRSIISIVSVLDVVAARAVVSVHQAQLLNQKWNVVVSAVLWQSAGSSVDCESEPDFANTALLTSTRAALQQYLRTA
jgi:hypothetical protein